jgi:hypothetical protein
MGIEADIDELVENLPEPKILDLIRCKKKTNDIILCYLKLLLDKDSDEEVDLNFIEYLFHEGIDVNFKDEKQENALFYVN